MSVPPSDNSPLLPHGGYEKLRSYKVAEAVYDATVVFCNRFIPKANRTHDQMVQAARSGVRNISEGSGAAATSRKSEMKLINVARASLNDELLKDYKSFLIQNGLRVWHKDSPEARAMRERLQHDIAPNLPFPKAVRPVLSGLAGLSAFVREAKPELAANAMLCAVNQAAYLLKRQLEKQARTFTEQGGFTESLHATRSKARAARGTSPEGPPCPLCGQPNRRRTAAKGPSAGKEFWGCSQYPDCRGIMDISSDESDESDASDMSDPPDHSKALIPMLHSLKSLTLVLRLAVACLAAPAFLASPSAEARVVSEIQVRRDWQMDGLRFHNRFCGARLSELIRIEEGHYVAVSRPEYRPINPSPWYSLEIESPEAREIRLAIRIDSAGPDHEVLWPARPWLSGDDGKTWSQLDAAAWQRGTDLATATLSLPAGRLRISAWKPYTLADCAAWCETLAARPDVRAVHVGWSAEGREIRAFHAAGPGSPPRYLAVLGGQHPPEITGDLGLTHFVGELLGESELAGGFRQAYRTVILPRINPDGKHHGHWRGTLGGKDPNRDWFDRTLPEIQAVTRHFETLAAGEGAEMVMAVDFHSTNADFFYVEAPGTVIRPADFTARWMQAVRADPQGHEPQIIPGAAGPGASRPWFSQRFGIPSYTREFSYSQTEEEIAVRCRAEARALMRILLEQAKPPASGIR